MENKELIEYLDQKFKAIDERFDKIDEQLNTVNFKLDRPEHETPINIMGMVKHIKKNTETLSHDIEYLSGKVGKHEMIIDRISKQRNNK